MKSGAKIAMLRKVPFNLTFLTVKIFLSFFLIQVTSVSKIMKYVRKFLNLIFASVALIYLTSILSQKHMWCVATLLKLTLLHGCISRFLNCINGTKSRNPSHITTYIKSSFTFDLRVSAAPWFLSKVLVTFLLRPKYKLLVAGFQFPKSSNQYW